jgi:hypothetical protein
VKKNNEQNLGPVYEMGERAEDANDRFPLDVYSWCRTEEEREAVATKWLRGRKW